MAFRRQTCQPTKMLAVINPRKLDGNSHSEAGTTRDENRELYPELGSYREDCTAKNHTK
jgi:hypothetical protein